MAENRKDLGTQGKADALKGRLGQAAGRIQRKVGEVIGNCKMQVKGAAHEVEGKLVAKGGEVEQKIDHKMSSDKDA